MTPVFVYSDGFFANKCKHLSIGSRVICQVAVISFPTSPRP